SSRTPASDVAAIRESPLNVTRHPSDFQFVDRWPSSRTQSSRPPNRVTTFHNSGASGAPGLLHSTHAHSPDADDANMSTIDQRQGLQTDENRARCRHLLHARSEVCHLAYRRVVHVQVSRRSPFYRWLQVARRVGEVEGLVAEREVRDNVFQHGVFEC